jgi:type IV pilus assembly protein PilC
MSPRLTLLSNLSSLVHAGVPLAAGCRKLAAGSSAPLRDSWNDLAASLEAGVPLSESLQSLTLSMEPWISDMVAAGEAAGTIDQMLTYLVDDMETRHQWRQSLMLRMVYPAILLHLTAFLPALPIYMNQGGLAALAWIAFFLALIYLPFTAVLLGKTAAAKSEPLKLKLESLLFRIPVLGAALRATVSGRFFRALASLSKASTRWEQALTIASRASGALTLQHKSQALQNSIQEGNDLTETLRNFHFFHIQDLEMLTTGELTGTVDLTLEKLSQNAWDRARQRLKVFSFIITALGYIICVVGIVLTILVIMGPIYYQVYELLQ